MPQLLGVTIPNSELEEGNQFPRQSVHARWACTDIGNAHNKEFPQPLGKSCIPQPHSFVHAGREQKIGGTPR